MATKKEAAAAAVAAGREHLRAWLDAAKAHGRVYYAIKSVSRSGMNRKIALATIRDGELVALWPSIPSGHGLERGDYVAYNAALDSIAKDWRFSFEKRAFYIGGCGMDMVFALVYDLCHKAYPTHEEAAKVCNGIQRDALL